jgi:CelD/BcsL family acetyltransferase involved in cellulose biosynthesis
MRQVRLITQTDEFEGLSGAWRSLCSSDLMRSWEFQRCWREHFAPQDPLRILVCEERGEIVGILPLVEQKRIWTGRTLVNFGSGKACLDDLGIIAHPESAVRAGQDFATFLLESKELPWDYIDLEGIRRSDLPMQAFADALLSSNPDCLERRPSPSCWAIELKEEVDGCHAWSKRMRTMMRKAREELKRGDFHLNIARTAKEAIEELKVMEEIHQARWKDRGVEGCFSNDSFAEFTREIIDTTCDAGKSFVAILRWQGTPAAGAICFIDSTTLYVYLASMAPGFSERKPGWKLNGFLAEYALRCGYTRFDFMRGDEEYKQRMGATPSIQERWMISSPRFLGRVRRTLYRTAREIKHFIIIPTVPAAVPQPSTTV